jgi:hypothetical protein
MDNFFLLAMLMSSPGPLAYDTLCKCKRLQATWAIRMPEDPGWVVASYAIQHGAMQRWPETFIMISINRALLTERMSKQTLASFIPDYGA